MRRAGDNIRKYWNEALARLRMYRTTQVEGALGCPKQLWISLLFWTEGEPILKLRCPFLRWNSISKDKAGKRTAENVFSRNHGGVVAQIAGLSTWGGQSWSQGQLCCFQMTNNLCRIAAHLNKRGAKELH